MKKEAEKLRFELDNIGTRRGRCMPPHLKERVSSWITSQRAIGRSAADLAAELGIAPGTALRWSSGKRKSLVPVRIVAEAPMIKQKYTVISPSGFRVEGLSIEEAAHLLRELG